MDQFVPFTHEIKDKDQAQTCTTCLLPVLSYWFNPTMDDLYVSQACTRVIICDECMTTLLNNVYHSPTHTLCDTVIF